MLSEWEEQKKLPLLRYNGHCCWWLDTVYMVAHFKTAGCISVKIGLYSDGTAGTETLQPFRYHCTSFHQVRNVIAVRKSQCLWLWITIRRLFSVLAAYIYNLNNMMWRKKDKLDKQKKGEGERWGRLSETCLQRAVQTFKSRELSFSFLCPSQTRISARGYHTEDPSTYCCCAGVFMCVYVLCSGVWGCLLRIQGPSSENWLKQSILGWGGDN